jgi:hypothetical protein
MNGNYYLVKSCNHFEGLVDVAYNILVATEIIYDYRKKYGLSSIKLNYSDYIVETKCNIVNVNTILDKWNNGDKLDSIIFNYSYPDNTVIMSIKYTTSNNTFENLMNSYGEEFDSKVKTLEKIISPYNFNKKEEYYVDYCVIRYEDSHKYLSGNVETIINEFKDLDIKGIRKITFEFLINDIPVVKHKININFIDGVLVSVNSADIAIEKQEVIANIIKQCMDNAKLNATSAKN